MHHVVDIHRQPHGRATQEGGEPFRQQQPFVAGALRVGIHAPLIPENAFHAPADGALAQLDTRARREPEHGGERVIPQDGEAFEARLAGQGPGELQRHVEDADRFRAREILIGERIGQ